MPKPATLLKVTLLHGCFSRLQNCTDGTKIAQNITFDSEDLVRDASIRLESLVKIRLKYMISLKRKDK